MVMLNDLDRFHLVIDVIDRVPGLAARAAGLRQDMVEERLRCRAWTREHGDDEPEIARLDLAVLSVDPRRQRRLDEPQAVTSSRATSREPVDGYEPADAVGHRVVHGGELDSSSRR